MSNGHVSRTRGCVLTDGGCMRADRENNKGPGSLWGIPLCGVSQRAVTEEGAYRQEHWRKTSHGGRGSLHHARTAS